DAPENLSADDGMRLHLFKLGGGQLARLIQNVIGHGYLAYVVKERARSQSFNLSRAATQNSCDSGGVNLHAQDMLMRHFILRVNRHGKRFDSFTVRLLHDGDALLDARAILPVAEIKSDEHGRAYDEHDQRIV